MSRAARVLGQPDGPSSESPHRTGTPGAVVFPPTSSNQVVRRPRQGADGRARPGPGAPGPRTVAEWPFSTRGLQDHVRQSGVEQGSSSMSSPTSQPRPEARLPRFFQVRREGTRVPRRSVNLPVVPGSSSGGPGASRRRAGRIIPVGQRELGPCAYSAENRVQGVEQEVWVQPASGALAIVFCRQPAPSSSGGSQPPGPRLNPAVV